MRKIERNFEEVEINGKVFTIREIDPALVLDLIEGKISFDLAHAKEILAATCGITLEDIRELGISFGQIAALYEVFKEVNAGFFQIFPLEEMLAGVRESIKVSVVNSLSGLSAALSPPDTPTPGITAGDTSTTA